MGHETTTTSVQGDDSTLAQESSPFIKKFKKTFGRKQENWRRSVLACACATTVVFVVNFILTLFLAAHPQREESPGRYRIYTGSREKVTRWNTILHLIVNVFSTILLSSSNYCMQCLSAPTRKEIDEAHQRNIWLDIGILSFRNQRYIQRNRVLLWWMLCISSFPLHLL